MVLNKFFKIFLFLLFSTYCFAHGMSESEKQIISEGGNLHFIYIGAVHMLWGYDHLLFVLGVIFLLKSFKDNLAFPDAVTTRGTKHLNELKTMVEQGHRAVMLYVIQRTDNLPFRLACEIDKKYCEAFKEVTKQGVEVLVYQSNINFDKIFIDKKIAFDI